MIEKMLMIIWYQSSLLLDCCLEFVIRYRFCVISPVTIESEMSNFVMLWLIPYILNEKALWYNFFYYDSIEML